MRFSDLFRFGGDYPFTYNMRNLHYQREEEQQDEDNEENENDDEAELNH